MANAWRVMSTFATTDKNGTPKIYSEGDIVRGDDPAVKGRADYFMDIQMWVDRESGVEQATAAPGERRALTRSVAKKARKRPAPEKPVENQTGVEAKPDTSSTTTTGKATT